MTSDERYDHELQQEEDGLGEDPQVYSVKRGIGEWKFGRREFMTAAAAADASTAPPAIAPAALPAPMNANSRFAWLILVPQVDGAVREVDMIQLGEHVFLNAVGVGLLGDISARAARISVS